MEFNRFDVSSKELLWDDPAAWLQRVGIEPHEPIEVVDSDVSALTAAADKVVRVGGPKPFLVNFEFQSSHESELTRTLWYRQTALDYRHSLSVLTVLVLLRKEANSPALTGVYERRLPDGRLTNRYDYQVVRLWLEDVETYLTGEISLVPLAPLTNVSEQDLPSVVRRMTDRINEQPTPRAAKLGTAAYVLMGLRYDEEVAKQLQRGIPAMRESTTYQAILREGREEGRKEGREEGEKTGEEKGQVLEARKLLIRLASRRFQPPDDAIRAALDVIKDIDRLESMIERTADPNIGGWDDLLAGN